MAVVVFEAYGTLFDMSALENVVVQVIGDEATASDFMSIWHKKHLEYAWASMLMSRYQDFDKLTELAFRFACKAVGFDANDEDIQTLLLAHVNLPLFEDVKVGIEQLEDRHKLAILSNGTFRSLQAMANAAGVLFSFDYILSAEPIRNYKPSRPVYQLVIDTFQCDKSEVTFVSSNDWDAAGAKAFGFRTIWLNRTKEAASPLQPLPDMTMTSFSEVVSSLTQPTS